MEDRKSIDKRTADIQSSLVYYLHARPYARRRTYPRPPFADVHSPHSSIASVLIHSFKNKNPSPIFALRWTTHGKRVIIGCDSGEFLLWSGVNFKYESLIQAHNFGVRMLCWTSDEQLMISGDNNGWVKVWKSTMKAFKSSKGHDEAIRDLSFSPGDYKFVTCSDDRTCKIWDLPTLSEEQTLVGHGSDVKCGEWHPYKALVATGSNDSLVKLWDPKIGKECHTIHSHKNEITRVRWHESGLMLLTASRDTNMKLYDLRMMRELQNFRKHAKEVTSTIWHPVIRDMFVSGWYDGSIGYWMVGHEEPVAFIENAHNGAIRDMDWHPIGHLLATGGSDNYIKFWNRAGAVYSGLN
jgi:WD40 repeat protein